MRRREFITMLGGAVAAWPMSGGAQQSAMPVIGFLNSQTFEAYAHLVAAFRQGLNEAGYVEGQNVVIEYRWAEGRYDRLPGLARELVNHQVAVIVSTGGTPPALAAKAATSKIPIVFTIGGDPVQLGLVVSLNRPGGNITGFNVVSGELVAKGLGLLRELLPAAGTVALLLNSKNPRADLEARDAEGAARAVKQELFVLKASSQREIDAAFATLIEQRAKGLLVSADPFFTNRREQVIALAAHHAVPTMYFIREFTSAGGLMSYGPNYTDTYRQAGVYTGRILRGEKPADLPVVQPTKFEFVLNLKTAKTLGLTVPPILLALADEVIE